MPPRKADGFRATANLILLIAVFVVGWFMVGVCMGAATLGWRFITGG